MEAGSRLMRVLRVREEAEGIRSFALAPSDGGALPPFSAGAHVNLHLPGGITRAYSLTNGPAQRDTYEIAVKREPDSRGGSAALHASIGENSELLVGLPRCNFALQSGAAYSILIAGGIGITPLLSMARHLAVEGRPFSLAYFSRSPEATAFAPVLREEFPGAVSFHHGLEGAPLAARLGKILADAPVDTQVYLCGPRPFMDLVGRLSPWPCHREDFRADPAAPSRPGDTAFDLHLARSGISLHVPADRSMADVLLDEGISLVTSCEQGICGACITPLLSGQADHRDQVLTDEERRSCITPCVSRSLGPLLVLDL